MAGSAKVDHDILRQIGALVATLPVMDVEEFHKELETVRVIYAHGTDAIGIQRCSAHILSYHAAAAIGGLRRRECYRASMEVELT